MKNAFDFNVFSVKKNKEMQWEEGVIEVVFYFIVFKLDILAFIFQGKCCKQWEQCFHLGELTEYIMEVQEVALRRGRVFSQQRKDVKAYEYM